MFKELSFDSLNVDRYKRCAIGKPLIEKNTISAMLNNVCGYCTPIRNKRKKKTNLTNYASDLIDTTFSVAPKSRIMSNNRRRTVKNRKKKKKEEDIRETNTYTRKSFSSSLVSCRRSCDVKVLSNANDYDYARKFREGK